MRNYLICSASVLLLSACGGVEYPDEAASGVSGNTGSSVSTASAQPYVDSALTDPEIAAAVPDTETSDLRVTPEFAFKASKNVPIELDFDQARGVSTSLSICTDYEVTDTGYEVNYASCTLTTTMIDGKFTHSLSVLSQYDTVLGVVWFPEPGTAPLFKIINIAENS